MTVAIREEDKPGADMSIDNSLSMSMSMLSMPSSRSDLSDPKSELIQKLETGFFNSLPKLQSLVYDDPVI